MKKILLATDGSITAENAAQFLARLPHEDKLELTVATALHVPGSQHTYLTGDWVETCMAQERQSAEEAFARIEKIFDGANVSLARVVREGHPEETLLAIANDLRPELLIVGATGHSAIARVLLGSTSDYLATRAPCSVLVVRPSEPVPPSHTLKIAIAYDESGPAQAALEELAEFGWACGTEICLVSIIDPRRQQERSNDDQLPEFLQLAVDQLQTISPHVTAKLVHDEHTGEGLVRLLETERVDLVLVGETVRTRLGHLLMGGVTRFVLRHAPCSVWITRNRTMKGFHDSAPQRDNATTKTGEVR